VIKDYYKILGFGVRKKKKKGKGVLAKAKK